MENYGFDVGDLVEIGRCIDPVIDYDECIRIGTYGKVCNITDDPAPIVVRMENPNSTFSEDGFWPEELTLQ